MVWLGNNVCPIGIRSRNFITAISFASSLAGLIPWIICESGKMLMSLGVTQTLVAGEWPIFERVYKIGNLAPFPSYSMGPAGEKFTVIHGRLAATSARSAASAERVAAAIDRFISSA